MTDPGVESLRASVDTLSAGVATLNRELVATNQRLTAQTRALWWAIGGPGVVVALFLLVGLMVTLDNREQLAESNRRWCPTLALLLPQSGEPASTTERGRRIAVEAQALYESFGCP